LFVFVVNLERPGTPCFVNRGILEATNLLAELAYEGQEFDVHLGVMARYLPVVLPCVDLMYPRAAQQAADWHRYGADWTSHQRPKL
jgi:hypothetical protein